MRKLLLSVWGLSVISFVSLDAQTDKPCLNLPAGTYECNPYSTHLIRVKSVKPLHTTKISNQKSKSLQDTNIVQDLIDKYVKINEPVRYKGEDNTSLELGNETLKHYLSMAQKLKEQRESLISKIIQEEEARFNKQQLILKEHKYQQALKILKEKQENLYGYYKVKSGDTLSHIAYMFGLKIDELAKLNDINKTKHIRINQKIKLPYTQEKIEVISKAEYKVKKGDTLHSIAKEYNLKVDDLIVFNKYILDKVLKVGEIVKLPLPYKLAEIKRKVKAKEEARKKRLAQERMRKYKNFGRHRLRVTATAYTSHRGQTDKTPFLAAWNNRIRPGMKIIAVSRDLLYRYGMKNGTKVKIAGLRGYYTVRDKMNKRYKKRIDIYMGVNRRKALRWGRRSVVIYW